jgi:hypothetical protein
MIDRQSLEKEMEYARQARMEAEAAGSEVEQLISAVQHFQPGKQRLLFMVAGIEAEAFGGAN